jgi:hypothetical protein
VFLRRWSFADYLVGAVIIAVFVQLFFTWHALSLPLFTIIEGMQGPQ